MKSPKAIDDPSAPRLRRAAIGWLCVLFATVAPPPVIAEDPPAKAPRTETPPQVASPQAALPAAAPAKDAAISQWRLVWTVDPATEARLSWSTPTMGERHVVQLRTEDGQQQRVVQCEHSGPYTGSKGDSHYHHANVQDLTPATKYFVTMESDGKRSPEFWFRTAPREDVPIRIIFGGDSRTGLENRRNVNAMIGRLLQGDPEILAFAHGGDYVASGRSFEQWSRWLSDHELTVADGRLLPVIPARGNHDSGPLFAEVFGFPADDGNYYAVDLGPQVRFVCLNTETSAAGDQRGWLEQELARARPRYRWLLAQYHRPAYPAVKAPSPGKVHWVPLFEKHDVDLVCEADGHNIKRTVPIRGDKADPSGVVYIGEGGLGVPQRSPKADRWYLKEPGFTARGHHVHLLTFTKDVLQCDVLLLNGEVLDRYRRESRSLSAQTAAVP